MSQALLAAAGGVILVGGGAVALKYGTSLFDGSDSSKIKIWIDENGKCKYAGRISSYSVDVQRKEQGSQIKEPKTDNLCSQLFNGTLDGSKVEIDESRMGNEYKSVKTEEDFKNRIKSSQNT